MGKNHFYDIINPKVEANLIYKCPGCSTSNYLTIKEARVLQKYVCCGCSAICELKPIRRIHVNIEYESQKPIPTNRLSKSNSFNKGKNNIVGNTPAPDYKDVLDSLINLGFNKKSAAAKIEKAVFILGAEAIPEKVLEKAITI